MDRTSGNFMYAVVGKGPTWGVARGCRLALAAAAAVHDPHGLTDRSARASRRPAAAGALLSGARLERAERQTERGKERNILFSALRGVGCGCWSCALTAQPTLGRD